MIQYYHHILLLESKLEDLNLKELAIQNEQILGLYLLKYYKFLLSILQQFVIQ